jgi:tetratricopeptide (TPR) repeat protein
VPPPVAGAVGTAAAMASPPGGAGLQAPVAAAVSPAAALAAQRAEREAKVQELMGAGNWNVLVLHAAEWTRKDPTYADAWKYLAVGYANMRQHDDAFLAGEKAAQLAPADRELWRNLGRLGIAAGRPEGALHAYEQALAIDGQDAASLVQAGRLQAELGLLPQAKATFDRALAASPGDPDALCGQAQVAQRQGRGKDAEAIVRDLRRGAKECSLAEAVPATVAQAAPASGSKPVPQRGR